MESGTRASDIDFWKAKALLDWQVELGVDEAIGNDPIDRYALEEIKPAAKVATAPAVQGQMPAPPPEPTKVDGAKVAHDAATAAQDLEGLHAAMSAFEGCALKAASRNMIFSGGVAGSPVMIIADAPDREDDRAGAMFAGRTGALLDKMLGAIGLGRSGDPPVYIVPVLPWNPPQNRDPNAEEVAVMRPFLDRHIELAAPKVLILMGNGPCQALLNRSGMTRLRGDWTEAAGLPAIPMFAPSYLLTNSNAKRDAWNDLLSLKSRLKEF